MAQFCPRGRASSPSLPPSPPTNTNKLRADLEAAAADARALIPPDDEGTTSDDATHTPTWASADPLDPPPPFSELAAGAPDLAAVLAAGRGRLDFGDPAAVRALTRAMLVRCFRLADWTVPDGALVPPVPARAAYLRRMGLIVGGGRPPSRPLRIIDVGCGANLIFPLLAASPVFGWTAVGLDVTPAALAGATHNLALNRRLVRSVTLRAGPPPPPAPLSCTSPPSPPPPPPSILPHAFRPGDPPADLLVCNPPFFESAAARAATAKDPGALHGGGHAGMPAETVWPAGGEAGFVGRMAAESAALPPDRVTWYSAMLGRKASVGAVKRVLAGLDPAPQVRTFVLAAAGKGKGGERTARWVVAWSFVQAGGRGVKRREGAAAGLGGGGEGAGGDVAGRAAQRARHV